MKNISKRYLFWCYMNNEGEAWFEVARDKKTARQNFSVNLGCDSSEIRSKLVCEISDQTRVNSRYGIQTDFLKNIGFEIVSENQPRIVRYHGKIYREGSFFEKILEDGTLPKFPCVYFFKILETNRYKIGSTGDLMARKRRLEGQQAHHIALNDFIETAENEVIEYFVKRLFEKYKVKGDEWFRMPNFVVALVKITFDLIKREIESEPSFDQKSELFEILISQMKEIIDEYKGIEEPPRKLFLKLQSIYDINSRRKGLLGRKTPKEYIIDQWFASKSKLENLEHVYIKTHCPHKINDIIEDEYGARFQVKKRSVYFLDKNKVSFHYEGFQILKNGQVGKKYHNFIIAKTII